MKKFSISISGHGIPESALEGRGVSSAFRCLKDALTKSYRDEIDMERDGDLLVFTVRHPEGDVSQENYDKWMARVEKRVGPLDKYVSDNALKIRW